jgi:preprotein translocase subunit SecF
MTDNHLKYIIKEALTQTDQNQIGVMIRKEIKNAFGSDLEKKVKDIVGKELKGSKFEKEVVKISKDVLEQLYRELWMRRMFWKNAIN